MSVESRKKQRRARNRKHPSQSRSPSRRELGAAQLLREIQVLRGSYAGLAQAVETNTQVFTEAFQLVDAQTHVMQRAFNDHIHGRVYTKENGSVDFYRYTSEYWACIGFSEFVAQLKAFSQELPSRSSLEVSEEDTIIFGGL